MTQEDTPTPVASLTGDSPQEVPHLPWLVALCVGSGAASLIYEVVWFQILELVIGSSAASLGLLLGTFMGGMCLGSILAPSRIPARLCPIRLWAMLQAGTAVLAIALLVGLPFGAELYAVHAPAGLVGIVIRGALCATCLLPPAILMGASLPVLSRYFEPTPSGRGHLGLLYAANTIGAVVGCLLAGFYLLPVHDTLVATLVAAMITGALAVASLKLGPAGAKPKRTGTLMPCPGTDRVASRLVLA